MAYTYYAYLLAKYQIAPSASFGLEQDPKEPFHFGFTFVNHGTNPIECLCNLNATVKGEPVKYEGFYNGERSIFLQPNSAKRGHFRIIDLLKDKSRIEKLKKEVNDENFKQLFYMNIEFRYYPLIDKNNVTVLRESYYYDFRDNQLKPDF